MVAVRTRVLSAKLPLFAAFLFSMLVLSRSNAMAAGKENFSIPILVYHRLGPTVTDRMTVTVSLFESHLKYLRENGYTAIALRQLVQYRLTGTSTLPSRSVVITADDGHHSVYAHMLSVVRLYRIPVTLFTGFTEANFTLSKPWD